MIKLIDILKELNTQPKEPIGRGGEHIVFPFKLKPGFVIKKFTGNIQITTKDWKQIIEFSQQHPEIFAIVDKVDFDKKYLVQEKLDEKTLTKDLKELDKYINDNNLLPDDEAALVYGNFGYDILTILYLEPDWIDILNNTPYEKTLKPKLEDFLQRLNKADLADSLSDIRISNVGYDRTGKIKILDFRFW